MKLKIPYFLLLALSILFFLSCQDDDEPSPPTTTDEIDEGRFEQSIYTSLTKTLGVQYGQNTTESGATKNLIFDFYEPEGDNLNKRPLIITVVGGGFLTADYKAFEPLAEYIARHGYVVANIDYRVWDLALCNPIVDVENSYENVIRARADLKAAIRFFRKDAATDNKYRIDPNKIFAIGHSAGAITSLAAGYMNDMSEVPQNIQDLMNMHGGIEGDSGNAGYDSSLSGVVNLSGAMLDADFVKAGDPPLISAHGDQDSVVPYCNGNAAVPCVAPVPVEGSCTIHEQADAVGLQNKLITITNGDHSAPLFSCATCNQEIIDFIFTLL